MRKGFLPGVYAPFILSGLALVAVFFGRVVSQGNNVPGEFRLEEQAKENESNEAMRAKEAMQNRYDRLKDENGNFTPAYYAAAVKQADQLLQSGSRAGALNLSWEELGPDNVGGRTRAILIDKRDATNNTIYAGGVSGGLWKSTNGGNNWSRISNWNQWMAISCIAQGPAPDYTIYVGTGEGLAQIVGTSFNSGTAGNGIYKLTSNDSPVLITPDAFDGTTVDPNSPWAAVNRIACNPLDASQIIAATQGGLYQSNDGGQNWTQITISGVTNGSSAADVKWSNDGQNIFASVGSNKILVRSLNGGFSWSKVTTTTNPGFPSTQGRMELAIAPSNSSVVYASIATTSGSTFGVYRSVDNGDTWTNIGSKGPLFDPFGGNNQGWYDNVVAVNPADPNKIYLAGVDLYTWNDQSGWKLADVGLGAGATNPNYIHPDKHAIVLAENNPNLMYVGCDGGVYKSTDALSAFPFPTYTVKNRGYNVTQCYSVAAGIAGEVMGGAQDNGTNYIDFKGNTRMAAKMVIGGDGIYSEISHIDPRVFFGGIYFGEVLRSGNATSSFDGFYDIKVDPQGHNQPSRCGGQKDQNATFISPFYLGETRTAANGLKNIKFGADKFYAAGEVVNVKSSTGKYPVSYTLPSDLNTGDTALIPDPIRSTCMISSYCGVWLTPDALDLGIIPRWFKLISSMNGTPYAFTMSKDGNTVYIGMSGGRVYRFPNFNAHIDTATYPVGPNAIGIIYNSAAEYTNTLVASGRPIEGISVDPNDPDHVVAVISGFSSVSQPHVYESTNGGANWTALTNGLPNMPVYDVVVHDANTIVIGSELGIWSWDGSTWHEENGGLPRVPVYRLIEKELYNDGCQVLYIGTHGRGMWRSTTLTAGGCSLTSGVNEVANNNAIANLSVYPNPVSSHSKISLTLDKADAVTFRVFDITGKLYREVTERNAIAGENLFDLDASGLSNGTYILAATVGNTRTQSRLFVVSK
ncbi:MAG: T9SS type A sorting domain-containing protein [Chitinophagales bacterium]